MTKRKPSTRSPNPKSPAKAQRAAQAILKSPPKPAPKRNGLKHESLSVEPPATAVETVLRAKQNDLKLNARLVEPAKAVLQADAPPKPGASETAALLVGKAAADVLEKSRHPVMDDDSSKAADLPAAPAKAPALQTKLQEMAQANVQFSLEFAERLATMKSPVEFPFVVAEFTNRRIAMLQKYSKDMVGFSVL
jgi:hypothetical protein